jgi:hypothetical protein
MIMAQEMQSRLRKQRECGSDHLQSDRKPNDDSEYDAHICVDHIDRVCGIDGGLVRECDAGSIGGHVLVIHVRCDVGSRSLRIGALDGDRRDKSVELTWGV